MPYKSEEREKFFAEEFPAIKQMLPGLVTPEGNVCNYLSPELVDGCVRKLAACVIMLTMIIEDDQSEIATLKAIIKAKGN